MVVYADRVTVHPDRIGADRSGQQPMVKWLILHTSEQGGIEDDGDAEALAAYLTAPGDRPSSSKPSGRYGSSYHAITDTDRIIPCVEDHLISYSAGGANRYGLHLCLPVRIVKRAPDDVSANVTRERWLDAGSRPYIRQAAEWIVDKAAEHDVPLRRITPEQMRAGESGYCDHWTASLAFGQSTHTDLGPAFPWDVLADDIATITTPQEDDMVPLAEPYRAYDSRQTGGKFDPETEEFRKIPVVYGHRAHVVVTCVADTGERGWVSVAGTPDAVGKTSTLNFEQRPGVQIRNGSVPLGLPDGHAYVRSTVPCHVIVDVFAV